MLKVSNYVHVSHYFVHFTQVSVATFAVYVMTGNELTATKAFVAIALFNVLRFPISVMPRVVLNFVQVNTLM